MTETLKILMQMSPSATSLTDFYTVPSSTSTVISSIIICNQNTTDESFRISLASAGAADNIKQYIYYDMIVLAKDTFIVTCGITLATTDVMRVYSSNTNLSFTIFGSEVTP